MKDIQPTNIIPAKRKPRRFFSEAEKKRILDEAVVSTFSEAARNNGISTGLLFQWRKNTEDACVDVADFVPADEHARAFTTITRLETIETLICEKLIADIRANKITAYNSATAFGSMANAVAKLALLKFELLQRSQGQTCEPEYSAPLDEPSLVEELEAERLCLELIKVRLTDKKQIADVIAIDGEKMPEQSD